MDDTQDFIQATQTAEGEDPRRASPREKKVVSVVIRANGVAMEAVTMDVSEGGARIFYLNEVLPVNVEVVIDGGASLKSKSARTVWTSREEKTYSISGLKFS
jgi:hypothetical protein